MPFLPDSDLYQSIISSHPFFSKLSHSDISELLNLSFEIHFAKDQVIVSQGDPVDAVYLVGDGNVEVTTRNGSELTPEFVLSKGDSIGIDNTGFYAKEGVRTATLTSISDVKLIGWPIETFINFLYAHPIIGSSIKQSSALILRVNFIKKIAIFTDLSSDQIVEIAKNVEEKRVEAGTVLFHQGEINEECYLIHSGKVEISITDKENHYHKTVTLESPMIFGELALLAETPRNATATMIESGSLLVFKKAVFQNLLHMHSSISESIVTLAMERSHPLQHSDVAIYQRTSSDNQIITILKNQKLKHYYQLSPVGRFLWEQIDGVQSIEEIIIQVFDKYGPAAAESTYNIIFDLSDSGFIVFPSIMNTLTQESNLETHEMHEFSKKLKKLFVYKLIFNNIDKNITLFFDRFFKFFFMPLGALVVSFIIIVGMFAFIPNVRHIETAIQKASYLPLLLLLIFATNYLLVVLHELGHALAVKYYGRDVHKAGFIFYWLGAFAFVDTSDMWLNSRTDRAKVDLAGPVTDLLLAGMASLCAMMIDQPEAKIYFTGVALMLYFGVISNLNPIDDNDGYHALLGYLKVPKLRDNSLKFLRNLTPKLLTDREYIYSHRDNITYWIACLAFLLCSVTLAFIAQKLLLNILPATILGISLGHFSWLLPLLVVLTFLFKISLLLKSSSRSS